MIVRKLKIRNFKFKLYSNLIWFIFVYYEYLGSCYNLFNFNKKEFSLNSKNNLFSLKYLTIDFRIKKETLISFFLSLFEIKM